MKKITFCIPSKTNLRYLKTCIPSIRENAYRKDHDIIIFVDSDEDGTVEWLKENENLYNYKYILNPQLGNSLYGIGKAYDACIEAAETPIVMIFHADMMLGKDADLHAFKHLKPLSVVCSTRIEPPLHPNAGEKIIMDFGMYPEDFKESEFHSFVEKSQKQYENQTTEGIFAPWMIYREDILSIGGHDPIMHSCREDSDLFNRFVLNGYQLIQSWDSLVYHLTGRGAGSFDGDTERHIKWKLDMENSTKEFIRKWGSNVNHTAMMMPIIPHKYNIKFDVQNCNLQILAMLEPWCSNIDVDLPLRMINTYINNEQPNTHINLKDKINNSNSNNDVIVKFDATTLTNESINFIVKLAEIFDANELEIGNYDFHPFKIEVKKVKHYEQNLINCKS
jgi:glycosyltransferase involved in cell wall biosynthesis